MSRRARSHPRKSRSPFLRGAWAKGQAAFKAGASVDTCPYSRTDKRVRHIRNAWLQGYGDGWVI